MAGGELGSITVRQYDRRSREAVFLYIYIDICITYMLIHKERSTLADSSVQILEIKARICVILNSNELCYAASVLQ